MVEEAHKREASAAATAAASPDIGQVRADPAVDEEQERVKQVRIEGTRSQP